GTWWDFNTQTIMPPGPRTLKEKAGMEFGLGVRAFVGVEYFFAPKISLGGELGWGIGFLSQGKGSVETEKWDGTAVQTITTDVGGGSQFRVDTDNLGGSINLLFYF
ncbi:MAG: hypothetical protein HQ565_12345, partial [Bacteroidetes bacterium]|nr:hypothetical protein [Bacteroidota bacterium]